MTENERLEMPKGMQDILTMSNQLSKDLVEVRKMVEVNIKELEAYRAIGTIEELQALKEKAEPKKHLHKGANWYRCPNGCEVHTKQFEKDWYCPKCGQSLDWQ